MKTRCSRVRGVVGAAVFGVVLVATGAQAAQEYTFADLGLGLAGCTWAQPTGASNGHMVGQAGSMVGYTPGKAVVWPTLGGPGVNLTPLLYQWVQTTGIDGDQISGYGRGLPTGYIPGTSTFQTHALLWTGLGSTLIDLNPAGSTESYAYGVHGGQQVGSASGPGTGGAAHAMLWSGSAGQVVDLNPTGHTYSVADAIGAGQQGGSVFDEPAGVFEHAALWSGSPDTFTDLHPAWADYSYVVGVSDGQEVGNAGWHSPSIEHAVLWSGTPGSRRGSHSGWVYRDVGTCGPGRGAGRVRIDGGFHRVPCAGLVRVRFQLRGPEYLSSTGMPRVCCPFCGRDRAHLW